MRIRKLMSAIVFFSLLALTACNKSIDRTAPLAFVPSDTPYVLANIEPMPKDVFAHLMAQMQPVFTEYGLSIDRIIADAKRSDALGDKILRAVGEEIRARGTLEKWEELGFKPDGHIALYGIGLMPVLRMELTNTAELKAAIERIEIKVGEKLPTRIIDGQEFWQIDLGNAAANTSLSDLASLKASHLLPSLQMLLALQNNQLVFSVIAPDSEDSLRKQLLGITRPAQSVLDSDALATLNHTHNYTFYSGYVDIRRSAKLIAAIAQLTDDPVCATELDAVTAHFPRITFGYTALTPQRIAASAKWELDPLLVRDLMTTVAPVPGMAGNDDTLLDFGFSFPLLKVKEFWLKQAQAVADKPFQCQSTSSASANEGFAKLQQQLNQTIPPPLSDLLGGRIVMSRFAFKTKTQPDFAGKALLMTENPSMLLGMAQLTIPAFRDFKLTADGQPVAIPPGIVPADFGPAFAAMNEHAIAVSIGQGEELSLNAFLNAPPAKTPTVLHMGFNGALYEAFAQTLDHFAAIMGTSAQEIEAQKQVMRTYAKTLKRLDMRVTLAADGVEIVHSMEMQ